jgi:surface antigen
MMQTLVKITLLALVVALPACGGDSSEGAAGASSSPAHTAEPGEPALAQVVGYEYVAAPADLEADMAATAEQTEQFYSGYSVHEVAKDGGTVGYLALFEATAEMASMAEANPDSVVGGMAGGIVGSGGAEDVEMTTIEGESVALATGPDLSVYAWYHDDTVSMFMVEGDVSPEASAFMEGYLSQVNA